MKTLVIHPADQSTDFLCPIYKDIENKTVIKGGISKKELLKEVKSHDRIMMLGHGSPMGLFAVGQFKQEHYMSYIIDNTFVAALKNKDNVFIWCFANQFVEQYGLSGFYSGMFISEVQEANLYNYKVSQETITYSNDNFSKIVGQHILKASEHIYKIVTAEYGKLKNNNPIIKYNNERLNYKTT